MTPDQIATMLADLRAISVGSVFTAILVGIWLICWLIDKTIDK